MGKIVHKVKLILNEQYDPDNKKKKKIFYDDAQRNFNFVAHSHQALSYIFIASINFFYRPL